MVGARAESRLGPKAWGAIVTVTEVDPVKALEATMDGYRVLRREAVRNADFVITST